MTSESRAYGVGKTLSDLFHGVTASHAKFGDWSSSRLKHRMGHSRAMKHLRLWKETYPSYIDESHNRLNDAHKVQ